MILHLTDISDTSYRCRTTQIAFDAPWDVGERKRTPAKLINEMISSLCTIMHVPAETKHAERTPHFIWWRIQRLSGFASGLMGYEVMSMTFGAYMLLYRYMRSTEVRSTDWFVWWNVGNGNGSGDREKEIVFLSSSYVWWGLRSWKEFVSQPDGSSCSCFRGRWENIKGMAIDLDSDTGTNL